jgi:transposase
MRSSQRREFTEEYKVEAVRLMRHSGKPVSRVARELGVNPSLLYRWESEQAQAQKAGTTRAGLKAEREELARLRGENARLKQELDFLKQAAAYFARERK